jgi:hypothetical protein
MTRLEELTLDLADDALSREAALELQRLLAHEGSARQTHIRLLQVEAGLRATRQNLDLAPSIMGRLRARMADGIARNVMTEIRANPLMRGASCPPEVSTQSRSPTSQKRMWRRHTAAPGVQRDAGNLRARKWFMRTVQQRSLGILLGPTWPWWKPKPISIALAACVILTVGLWAWFFGPTMGKPILAEVQGTGLRLERAGQTLIATAGMSLSAGDVLRASENGTATITFVPEKTRVSLNAGTELKLSSLLHGKRFELHLGKLEASVAPQRPFRPLVLNTPHADARVVGTHFILTVATNATRLDVTEGSVRFTRISDRRAVRVPAGSYAVAAPNYEFAALPKTGGLLRECWIGVTGKTMFALREDPRFPDHPDKRDFIDNLELKVSETNQLGVRLRGYLHPPVTGNYHFWLNYSLPDSSYAEVTMSPTENPAEEVAIARDGKVGVTQAPPPIQLEAGRRYYIEIQTLINTKTAGYISLEWKPPGGTRELLTGEFLSPAKPKR